MNDERPTTTPADDFDAEPTNSVPTPANTAATTPYDTAATDTAATPQHRASAPDDAVFDMQDEDDFDEDDDLDDDDADDAVVADSASAGRRTWSRKRRVLAASGAALLLFGAGAGTGILGSAALAGNDTTASASGTSNAFGQSGSTGSGTTGGSGSGSTGSGTTGGFGGGSDGSSGSGTGGFSSGGFGSGSQDGTDGSGSSSASVDSTAATSSQIAGVVTIVSTLKYQSASSAGTGIVLTSSGEILTNNHVVEGATSIKVTVQSTGKVYTATVVGTDATHDIAVLKLANASGLTTAKISSSSAAVGDKVTAVGNAEGGGTLMAAAGSVTALKQAITTASENGTASEQLKGLIETDADVVSGDSGGPLLNSDGEVVGIDTAASSGTSDITGYAITISSALDIADDIVAGKESSTIQIGYPAFLGVEVSTTSTTTSGATIGGVISGTPAATAGLEAGDVVTKVDGSTVSSPTSLTTLLQSHDVGDSVSITYTDSSGASHSATVTLIAGPAA